MVDLDVLSVHHHACHGNGPILEASIEPFDGSKGIATFETRLKVELKRAGRDPTRSAFNEHESPKVVLERCLSYCHAYQETAPWISET